MKHKTLLISSVGLFFGAMAGIYITLLRVYDTAGQPFLEKGSVNKSLENYQTVIKLCMVAIAISVVLAVLWLVLKILDSKNSNGAKKPE